jgi:hypothetical protein
MPTPQRQGTCASTRDALLCASALALRLRLIPDVGLAQLFLAVSINQAAWASGEQYVWPEVPGRTGSPSGFGDLMGELRKSRRPLSIRHLRSESPANGAVRMGTWPAVEPPRLRFGASMG